MKSKLTVAVLLSLAGISLASAVKAQTGPWGDVRKLNHPAIVYLKTEIRYPNGFLEVIEGTGFLVHSDGWILTNAHVVPRLSGEDTKKGATLRAAASIGGRGELERIFEVKRRDTDKDLALLALTHEAPQAWTTVAIDLDRDIVPDQDVYAMGFPAANPRGLDGTPGTIRGRLGELWLTNASINPGNSGGPVFSKEGRVVGVSKGAVPDSNQMNVVIPIRFAKQWLDEIGVVSGGRSGGLPPKTEQVPKPTKAPSITHSKPLSFKISIMGAERCIIEWEPREDEMTEQSLHAHGVNVENVKQGIVAMNAAILQRTPTNVSILPGKQSDVMPGPAYTLSSLGVNSALYDNFHIYLRTNEIQVLLYKRGNYIRKVNPDEIGIDWQSFRNAVDKSLFELYQHQYRIEFGEIKIVDYETSEWHYSISYMLRN